MGMTALQARNRYIINSMSNFLDRIVKQPYDVEVAQTASAPTNGQRFPTPLSIRRGKPDDINIVRVAPSIAISVITSGERDRAFGIGEATVWRHRSFLLSCFPSLDANGAPCDTSSELLQSYMQDAFETEQIKILDQTNPLFSTTNILYLPYNMEIVKVSDPIPRAMTTALAQEKHRFDLHVGVKYPVIGSLET